MLFSFRAATSSKYWNNIGEQLFKFHREGYLCDTVLTGARGEQFRAHSVLLAAASPVLKSAIDADIASENSSSHCAISVPDVDPDLLEVMIRFIYTGNLELPQQFSTVKDLKRILNTLDHFKIEQKNLNGGLVKLNRYVFFDLKGPGLYNNKGNSNIEAVLVDANLSGHLLPA